MWICTEHVLTKPYRRYTARIYLSYVGHRYGSSKHQIKVIVPPVFVLDHGNLAQKLPKCCKAPPFESSYRKYAMSLAEKNLWDPMYMVLN